MYVLSTCFDIFITYSISSLDVATYLYIRCKYYFDTCKFLRIFIRFDLRVFGETKNPIRYYLLEIKQRIVLRDVFTKIFVYFLAGFYLT